MLSCLLKAYVDYGERLSMKFPLFDIRLVRWLLAFCFTTHLAACSSRLSPASDNETAVTASTEFQLPALVAETSGLVCLPDGNFLTINDSGNAATVFKLNSRGEVVQQFPLDATNRDWEAMTVHQQQLWIADIGNNSGGRRGGDLYQTSLALQADQKNTTIKTSFTYPEMPLPPLQSYLHDFDAEAIVSANDKLLMFNKAWQSQHSTVYQLISTATGTKALRLAHIDGLPGVITGAAFSEPQQVFILTGYARFRENMLNMALYDDYRPFLAVLDSQFQLQKIEPLVQGGQVEAICIDQRQQIWLTQEKSKRRPALLWRFGSVEQLIPKILTN